MGATGTCNDANYPAKMSTLSRLSPNAGTFITFNSSPRQLLSMFLRNVSEFANKTKQSSSSRVLPAST